MKQPRMLAVGLVLAPVMITVIVGAIMVFIRSVTGIVSGNGNIIIQGGEIVLGLLSLWAMYVLGMAFFYADRDWVTDLVMFVVIAGACLGMYAVVKSFPSTFLAIVRHLFYGYVSVSAVILAIRLLAPYKGIGNVRYNEAR